MKTILVDPSRCLQCSNCWVACKDEHCDNDWSPITAPQGADQWWIRVEETEVASGAHMKLNRVPILCQQCADAPCMKVAKDGAVYRRDDGIVLFDPVKAKGQKAIVDACPYGTAFWNAELDLPQKCTFCAHLLDVGRDMPRCVAACPNDALQFVDDDGLRDENLTAPLECLKPEAATEPMVKYVNLPKSFVAGEIASDDETLCLEGVYVTVVNQVSGLSASGFSGTFGDFHVDVAKPGFYTVSFDKPGYKRKTFTDVDLREPLSLDVVKMWAMVE